MQFKLILLYFLFIPMRFHVNSKVRKIRYDESQVCDLFSRFVKQYGKKYSNNRTEYDKRLEVFTKRVMDINQRNEQIDDIQLGISRFSDMTDCEIDERFSGHELLNFKSDEADEKLGARPPEIPCGDVPEEWDWSYYNAVTPPRYYDCKAIETLLTYIEVIQSLYAIKKDHLIYLSVQQVLDCVEGIYCDALLEGSVTEFFSYLMNYGLADDEDYPYEGEVGECDDEIKELVVKMDSYTTFDGLQPNEDQLKAIVFHQGPLRIGVRMGTQIIMEYSNGIGTSETLGCKQYYVQVFHGLLVGYGESDGVPYWKIKGVFGPEWGEDGYLRILRGNNTCGILNSLISLLDISLLNK